MQISSSSDLLAEQHQAQNFVSEVLKEAKAQGASSAEVVVGNDIGFSVNVRLGEVETVEYNRDKGVAITVYMGQRKGSASTTDTSIDAIKSVVTAACHIARLTSEDPCAGLADPDRMAKQVPNLDLYYPWSIQPDEAIELAKECEALARASDKRIINSEGAVVDTTQGLHVYGNTHGFLGAYRATRHSLSCALVAQDKVRMQRDYGYTVARDYRDLNSVAEVARETSERTLKRLDAQRLKTCQVPVIFQADIASSLWGNFLSAISGGNLYRKSSFLLDQLGKKVFSSSIHISERPHILKGLGSAPFDGEGVATTDRELVQDGILQGYILSSYSARKLGMQSTGNSGGAHNILIKTSEYDLPALLKKMDKGILVTELLGQGVNLVTGDYSRGIAGFWVENGEIQYPIEEITVAGNLRDMFNHIVAVGNDIDKRSHILTGSVLLDSMMVAGT